jgi:hypothetical protein
MAVWIVVDPDHPETPIGGAWSTFKLASDHCPAGYEILKVILDTDLTRGP